MTSRGMTATVSGSPGTATWDPARADPRPRSGIRALARRVARASRSLRPGRRAAGWLVPGVPALAELAAGGYQVGRPSLWRDEGYTRSVALRPAGDIIALLGHVDAVHGLYYLVMHLIVTWLGASAVILRLPSVIATSLAAGLTAALGRRLTRAAGLSLAGVTGLLAGLLLAAFPLTTWYAQDARPYAMATLCAVGSSYLLVRGITAPGWRWWAGYAAAGLLLAALNLMALLLLAAHGVSLLLLRRRAGAASPAGRRLRAATRGWLVASLGQAVLLSPLLVLAAAQSAQLSWVTRPGIRALTGLVASLCGTVRLIPLVAALVLGGTVADLRRRNRAVLVPALVTLPWLVLPPAVLLAVSAIGDPVYVKRYVVFCAPAAALLTAGGLAWLVRLARLLPVARRHRALAAGPAIAAAAVLAVAVTGPQARVRTTASHRDNLRAVAAVLASHEQPGDAVVYLPSASRSASLAYPRPFLALRDIGMLESPVASATLTGTREPVSVLADRIAGAQRLWVISWRGRRARRYLRDRRYRPQLALIGRMQLAGQWTISSVRISLYASRHR